MKIQQINQQKRKYFIFISFKFFDVFFLVKSQQNLWNKVMMMELEEEKKQLQQ
jgi:hypothetical protein